jgi:hypothetical protein
VVDAVLSELNKSPFPQDFFEPFFGAGGCDEEMEGIGADINDGDRRRIHIATVYSLRKA